MDLSHSAVVEAVSEASEAAYDAPTRGARYNEVAARCAMYRAVNALQRAPEVVTARRIASDRLRRQSPAQETRVPEGL